MKIYTWYLFSLSIFTLLRRSCTVETRAALSYPFVLVVFIRDKLIKVINDYGKIHTRNLVLSSSYKCHELFDTNVGHQPTGVTAAIYPIYPCLYLCWGFYHVSDLLYFSCHLKHTKIFLISICYAGSVLGASHCSYTDIWAKTTFHCWHMLHGFSDQQQ